MDSNTSNDFCNKILFKYIQCIRLNKEVFGKDHCEDMCFYIKEVIDNSKCNNEDFNKKLENQVKKIREN